MSKSLLLTSAGLTTDAMRQALLKLLQKRSHLGKSHIALYIPDAALAEGSSLPMLERDIKQQLSGFGVSALRVLEVAKATPEQVSKALVDVGVIYAECGNTFFLQYHMQRSGFATRVQPLVEAGEVVYVGSSAGSIVAGPTAGIALWKGWDDPSVVPYGNPPDYSGLFLTDGVSIFPHYSEQWEALVVNKRKMIDHQLVTLSDYQAYLIDGDDRRVI
mmetsp:Transcript_7580/g.15406  ORF Transcript_7580/g.15406 Transcript_7580/m.15406 type:complete len:217 (+) Transcript_7580:201-851(+)